MGHSVGLHVACTEIEGSKIYLHKRFPPHYRIFIFSYPLTVAHTLVSWRCWFPMLFCGGQ